MQRRSGGAVSFDKKWAAYKNGFGHMTRKLLNSLTAHVMTCYCNCIVTVIKEVMFVEWQLSHD